MTCTKAPKKQAIFRIFSPIWAFFGAIAKHCPLKQGLRLLHFNTYLEMQIIAKHCPLKQGLRQS